MFALGSTSSHRLQFDLHMHSTRSDGRYAPDEVARRCAVGGLDVIALTDHDLAGGLAIGHHRVEGRDVWVIGGAEISALHAGREYHLLVYFAGPVPDAFQAFCRDQCRQRAARYAAAIDNLGLPGLPPPSDEAREGHAALTRHHLARALVDGGHVGSVRDAFARYLGESHGRVPPITLPMVDAIRLARACGGVTSWAHPPHVGLAELLPPLVDAGLHALEGLRPNLNSEARHKCRSAAKRFGLALTGGSDWHGWADDGDLGLFRVPGQEIAPFLGLLAAA